MLCICWLNCKLQITHLIWGGGWVKCVTWPHVSLYQGDTSSYTFNSVFNGKFLTCKYTGDRGFSTDIPSDCVTSRSLLFHVKDFKLHFNLVSLFFQLQGLTMQNEVWLRFASYCTTPSWWWYPFYVRGFKNILKYFMFRFIMAILWIYFFDVVCTVHHIACFNNKRDAQFL